MAQQLEGKLTNHEALQAFKHMKNNKTPDTEGYTCTTEFFKFFWKDVGISLLQSVNYSFDKGELSITPKQIIISILPKGDKPREHLKNWRHTSWSLLNVTYKIISACIANRFKQVLCYHIYENQKGFLKNRFIEENTRIIYDTLYAAKENNIPGLPLLIDFEKASDSVSWSFMIRCIDFYDLSAWCGCWFVVYIRRFINKFLNMCPFDYSAVAGSGKVGP